jgi:hypothetical protein
MVCLSLPRGCLLCAGDGRRPACGCLAAVDVEAIFRRSDTWGRDVREGVELAGLLLDWSEEPTEGESRALPGRLGSDGGEDLSERMLYGIGINGARYDGPGRGGVAVLSSKIPSDIGTAVLVTTSHSDNTPNSDLLMYSPISPVSSPPTALFIAS